MTTISYTKFRNNLAGVLDSAEQDFEPVVVTRNKGRKSVVMSYDEYSSLLETAYLLSSEPNRKHLEKSLAELEQQKIVNFQA